MVLVLYFTAYVVFRQTNTEVWQQDGKSYVIYPKGRIYLYYLFRPISYLDGKLTGMNFHIGSHN